MSKKNFFHSKYILPLALVCALALSFCSCAKYKDPGDILGSETPTAPTLPAMATEETGTAPTEPQPEKPTSDYADSGYFQSDTGTGLVLKVEWSAAQDPDIHQVNIGVKVYLEFEEALSPEASENNTLTVNGEQVTFPTKGQYSAEESPVLLYEGDFSAPREDCAQTEIPITCKVYFNSEYEEYRFKSLTAQGTVLVSEKYAELPGSASVDVKVIKQHPELPNGCEVTSLAMALNYNGYKISKMALKDGYLPIGTENIYEYNIGDPANKTGSYGCYSPVIKKTADAFFADKGITDCTAIDITHCNISELYYRVAQGQPVIVWATQYMEKRPYIIKSWEENGLTFNWKAPLHCMLLTGYDGDTVTLTDPIYGVVEHDRELFETRWHQMGEQAVVLEKTEKE